MDEDIAPTFPVFAVYFPDDVKNSPRVYYQSLKEATKFANSPTGRSRGARFRRFGNASEATTFYEGGDALISTSKSKIEVAVDPVVAFSSVSPIEMNKLKKVIETDNIDEFRHLTQLNPRYLINTSGDTPALVQQGYRYNALHIAAQNGSTQVADHILTCVSNTDYLIRLYGTNDMDVAFRKKNIIMSYLNTPEIGYLDTPLHMAAKRGHAEVARIIASYRQTNRDVKNKENKKPIDVVCDRYTEQDKEEKERELKKILHNFYVAIYKCADHSLATRWIVSSRYPDDSLVPPFTPILSPFHLTAVAGPFENEQQATQFQRKWKGQGLDRRRKDFDRGAEKIGRELACKEGVQWAESWPFQGQPIDVRSDFGLAIFENYLKKKSGNEEKKEEVEEKENIYETKDEDAQEDWNNEFTKPEGAAWTSEGDSLGSLYSKMESLSMSDHSVVNAMDEEVESLDKFVTPPSSTPPLFIDHSPSKVDDDLFEVLSSLNESNLAQYPLVKRFLSSVNGLEETRRANLPSLASPRYWQNSPRSRINSRVPRRNRLAELDH